MSITKETLVTGGGNVSLCRFEGEVLHADRRLETQVSSSGGGGYIGPSGGHIADARVSATTTDHQTIFLRDSQGCVSTTE